MMVDRDFKPLVTVTTDMQLASYTTYENALLSSTDSYNLRSSEKWKGSRLFKLAHHLLDEITIYLPEVDKVEKSFLDNEIIFVDDWHVAATLHLSGVVPQHLSYTTGFALLIIATMSSFLTNSISSLTESDLKKAYNSSLDSQACQLKKVRLSSCKMGKSKRASFSSCSWKVTPYFLIRCHHTLSSISLQKT